MLYVADAVGGRSQIAHRTGIERLAHAGAVPTTALAVVTELFRDWAGPLAAPALDVIYWYFTEVPKLTDRVGVRNARLRLSCEWRDLDRQWLEPSDSSDLERRCGRQQHRCYHGELGGRLDRR